MKKILGLVFAAFLVGLIFTADSFAQTNRRPYGNINQRQRNQQNRIYQGIRSGELTRREAYRLERGQYRTNRLEQRYRNSGNGLSRYERLRLENRQNRDSYRIYRQKHDKQDRP